jgi:hypothetical protein
MCQHTPHFALCVELHEFRRAHAVDAVIFHDTTLHTGIQPDEVEAQRGIVRATVSTIYSPAKIAAKEAHTMGL